MENKQGPPPPGFAPPPPSYSAPGQPNIVIVQPPTFGPETQRLACPHCGSNISTRVETEANTKTHLFALLFCLFGLICCVPCPYCIDSCLVKKHYCPSCKNYLGQCDN